MSQILLDEKNIDAMLITDPYNMRHLSGFRGGEGALYISRTQQVLITDSRYTEQAGKESDFTVIEENMGHKREHFWSVFRRKKKHPDLPWDTRISHCCARSLTS